MKNKRLDRALSYAAIGIPVLPLWWPVNEEGEWICSCPRGSDCPNKPGKHPLGVLVHNGLKDATTDPELIKRWWEQYPDANIGGVMGKVSGFIAADIDPRHGGDKTWATICELNNDGKEYDTPASLTGSLGHHYLFGYTENVVLPSGIHKAGVDIQSDGKYIVLPDSFHITGREYRWLGDAMERLQKRQILPFPAHLKLPGDVEEVSPQLHDWKRRNLKPGEHWWDELYAYRRKHWQEWDSIEEGVRRLTEWGQKISCDGVTGCPHPTHHINYQDLDTWTEDDFIRIEQRLVKEVFQPAWYKQFEKDQLKEGNGKKKNGVFEQFAVADTDPMFRDAIPPRPPDLIDKFLPADSVHVELLGHRGEGKTMVAMIMALEAAVGRKVFGKFAVARPLRVLFIEDDTPKAVMERRGAAISAHMKLTPEEVKLGLLNFLPVYAPGFSFGDIRPLRAFLQAQKDADLPVDVVILDSRTTSWPGSPDDPELAQLIYGEKIKPLAREYDTRVFIISHPPKAKVDALGRPVEMTISGTAVHERDADTIVGFHKDAGTLTVKFTWLKSRDSAENGEEYFEAVIEPRPRAGKDDDPFDEIEVWQPRGWVSLKPSSKVDAQLAQGGSMHQGMVNLLTLLSTGKQSRRSCVTYIKTKQDKNERFTDDMLGQLMQDNRVTQTKLKPAEFEITPDGVTWLAANGMITSNGRAPH
jgi:hypothetical protein